MKKQIYMAMLFSTMILSGQSAVAQVYEVPPSLTTSSSVPVISDHAMEVCVILYNDAKSLKNDIDSVTVDRYSQSSVSSYNSKVNHHSQMIRDFNSDCAGKQSESAKRAAEKLNKERNKI